MKKTDHRDKPKPPEPTKCSACDGSGDCPFCNGKGCDKCNQTGDCQACNGFGTLPF